MYVPEELLNQAQFALDAAATILGHYVDFFGEEYPLHKQGEGCVQCKQLNTISLLFCANYRQILQFGA